MLVDGSVVEVFWDGGRARATAVVFPNGSEANEGVQISAGDVPAGAVTADAEVWAGQGGVAGPWGPGRGNLFFRVSALDVCLKSTGRSAAEVAG